MGIIKSWIDKKFPKKTISGPSAMLVYSTWEIEAYIRREKDKEVISEWENLVVVVEKALNMAKKIQGLG